MTFRFRPIYMGILSSLLIALFIYFVPDTWLEGGRELYFDRLTQFSNRPQSGDITVVDIDRKAFSNAANQNWRRTDTAKLIDAIAADKPAVIAFDLVFSTECEADEMNEQLATALANAPTVLGFLLSDAEAKPPQPVPPLAIAKSLTVPEIWFLPGAEVPCPIFQESSEGVAASFLIGDEDSRVRRVQAFSIIGADPYPALGIEAARRYLKIKTPILGGTPPWLKLGRNVFSLAEDGSVRFVASDRAAMVTRTISAADVVANKVHEGYFTGKIVFIGSSLPNLGGLRSSAAEPLVASVQLHADIANSVIGNFLPSRDDSFVRFEALYALLIGLLISLLTARFRPSLIAVCGISAIVLSLALSYLMFIRTGILTDGFTVAFGLMFVLLVAAFSQFAETRRAEGVARQRFAQYLPQSIVNRYIDTPDWRPVSGEERQVTALFTDIEGFSELAGRLSPKVLVNLLSTYFAEVTKLVSDHGGMVDKIVGDAVHAFFNAPDDLHDHVSKAISCSIAIHRLTEEMRTRPDFARHGFARTRIGIETGMAVLGEVGIGGKLDYTAHGNAINLAARLQDANKFLGTTICVGPAAQKESSFSLRALGEHEIRGFGTMPLFTADDLVV